MRIDVRLEYRLQLALPCPQSSCKVIFNRMGNGEMFCRLAAADYVIWAAGLVSCVFHSYTKSQQTGYVVCYLLKVRVTVDRPTCHRNAVIESFKNEVWKMTPFPFVETLSKPPSLEPYFRFEKFLDLVRTLSHMDAWRRAPISQRAFVICNDCPLQVLYSSLFSWNSAEVFIMIISIFVLFHLFPPLRPALRAAEWLELFCPPFCYSNASLATLWLFGAFCTGVSNVLPLFSYQPTFQGGFRPNCRSTVSWNLTNDVSLFSVMNEKYGRLRHTCHTQLNKKYELHLQVQHVKPAPTQNFSWMFLTTPMSLVIKGLIFHLAFTSRHLCRNGVLDLERWELASFKHQLWITNPRHWIPARFFQFQECIVLIEGQSPWYLAADWVLGVQEQSAELVAFLTFYQP